MAFREKQKHNLLINELNINRTARTDKKGTNNT